MLARSFGFLCTGKAFNAATWVVKAPAHAAGEGVGLHAAGQDAGVQQQLGALVVAGLRLVPFVFVVWLAHWSLRKQKASAGLDWRGCGWGISTGRDAPSGHSP